MNLFELAIVYLALGAPLGVYHAATHWTGSAASIVSVSILNVCLWPLAAIFFAYLHFSKSSERLSTAQRVDRITEKIISAAYAKLPPERAIEFRELTARYIGISQALDNEIGTPAVDEVLAIIGRAEAGTARACVARTNRRKLARHRDQARTRFILAAERLGSVAIVLELAHVLGDHEAVDHLASLIPASDRSQKTAGDRVSAAA